MMGSRKHETDVTQRVVDAQVPTAAAGIDSSRRRLFRGAAGGTGILLAVQAKSALGQTLSCQSPSATMSGNTSPRPAPGGAPCSGGRSPGFWKVPQHFSPYWANAGAVHPTFNVTVNECDPGLQNLTIANVVTTGTTMLDKGFVGAPSNATFWAVLAFPTSFSGGQLMRHLVAAWLNAGYFPGYPVSKAQVIDMWNATKSGGRYCPPAMSCVNGGWTGDDVIAYIKGMYDFNAAVEPGLCKP